MLTKALPAAAVQQMEKDYLVLKGASASRPSGDWNDDDYDVLADGVVVGRIMKANAAPVDAPWLWTLAFGHQSNPDTRLRREAAMAAFAKSWRRESGEPFAALPAVGCTDRV